MSKVKDLRETSFESSHWIKVAVFLSLLLLVTLPLGCGNAASESGETSAKEWGSKSALPSLEERVDKIIGSMSMKEKVGQMVMIGFHGTDPNDDTAFMLNNFHVGGVIFYERNMKSKEQVKSLVSGLQKQSDGDVPLFVGIDEEGGLVSRMKESLPPPPSQREIGDAGDSGNARKSAKDISVSLKDMGFNINFAPVADVGSGRGRSFSDDAATVADFTVEACKGYAEGGILCSLKHFPGIGKGIVDSHVELSDINSSLEELENDDLIPFARAIKELEPGRYWVMVSHLRYPAIDPDSPASLSKAVTTGLLRERMGYEGIIITDDMEMGAVADGTTDFGTLAEKAVNAGADILLVCHEYPHQQAAYNGILKAVEEGRISEKRIDDSLRRIIMTKLKYL